MVVAVCAPVCVRACVLALDRVIPSPVCLVSRPEVCFLQLDLAAPTPLRWPCQPVPRAGNGGGCRELSSAPPSPARPCPPLPSPSAAGPTAGLAGYCPLAGAGAT